MLELDEVVLEHFVSHLRRSLVTAGRILVSLHRFSTDQYVFGIGILHRRDALLLIFEAVRGIMSLKSGIHPDLSFIALLRFFVRRKFRRQCCLRSPESR